MSCFGRLVAFLVVSICQWQLRGLGLLVNGGWMATYETEHTHANESISQSVKRFPSWSIHTKSIEMTRKDLERHEKI